MSTSPQLTLPAFIAGIASNCLPSPLLSSVPLISSHPTSRILPPSHRADTADSTGFPAQETKSDVEVIHAARARSQNAVGETDISLLIHGEGRDWLAMVAQATVWNGPVTGLAEKPAVSSTRFPHIYVT